MNAKQGACGCGPKFTITLTDARLIQRRQECSCCGTGPRFDTMLFLSDISSITDSVMGKCCGLCNCNCCCCCCCSSCCAGTNGKEISFTGPFGTLVFTFDKNDVPHALVHIPAAALPHKTLNAKDTSNQF